MRARLIDALSTAALFTVWSVGIAAVLMFALPFLGYATYGSYHGWVGVPENLSWRADVRPHLLQVLLFLLLGIPTALVLGLGLWVVAGFLKYVQSGRWLFTFLGAAFAAGLAWYAIRVSGAYMSLGAVAQAGGIAGAAWFALFAMGPQPSLGSCRRLTSAATDKRER